MKYNGKNLKRVLNDHKKWLFGEGGSQADFTNTTLENVDLSEKYLKNCIFKDTCFIRQLPTT